MGVVVAVGIEHELSDQLTVLGDHPDPKPIDERDHPRADEPASQPDVVRPGVVAERNHAVDADLVPPHPEVRGHREPGEGWHRLRPGGEGLRGRAPPIARCGLTVL